MTGTFTNSDCVVPEANAADILVDATHVGSEAREHKHDITQVLIEPIHVGSEANKRKHDMMRSSARHDVGRWRRSAGIGKGRGNSNRDQESEVEVDVDHDGMFFV